MKKSECSHLFLSSSRRVTDSSISRGVRGVCTCVCVRLCVRFWVHVLGGMFEGREQVVTDREACVCICVSCVSAG